MTVAEGGGIFISYRRQESSHLAGRLADRLADRFGEGQVFIDVDTIEPGVDFAEEIFRAVAACRVLLAIIGPDWLTATDERGARRLDDPDDIVRLEIEAALARGVRVIPILVESAVMPDRQDLPESLALLGRRNALLIRHETFRSDAGRLVAAIERILAPASGGATAPTAPDPHSVRPAGKAPGKVAQKGPGSSRNDLVRARLLADAERTANAITDKSLKVSALSRVAGAMAATDPDRATRLLADAERTANSIIRKSSKASPLRNVAEAVAATDPDRAERIASSITDESSKVLALRNVAEAVAATDPDRAERIASSITDESLKVLALSDVAEAMAATDPDRATRLLADAERIANSITDESWKVSALSRVAEALAATDPDRAARLLADAERIANSITDESWKVLALSRVAEAMAATDPDRATRLLADAERIANSITDEPCEGIGAERRRQGDGRHRPRPTPNASPTPSPPSP